jgi:probable DNA metabolism protein
MIYVYDGTFNGLLTAIFEAYYRKEDPSLITTDENLQTNFLEEIVYIKTDNQKSARVYDSIVCNITLDCAEDIYYTFLSSYEDSATWIYQYLKLGFKVKKKLSLYQNDEAVMRIRNTVYKVLGEKHRLMGLHRFSMLESGIYYAPISPDHDVTELLAPHFAKRLADQNWVIHDVKRKKAAVYDTREWYITDFDYDEHSLVKEKNQDFQDLWKRYFSHISIKERRNISLHRKMMPARYWKHMTEKQ